MTDSLSKIIPVLSNNSLYMIRWNACLDKLMKPGDA